MAIKFGRGYTLLVQQIQNAQFVNPIEIQPPYRIDFDILQSNYSSSNVSKITIYNLAPNTRNAIRKDQYDGGNLKQVVLKAGYGQVGNESIAKLQVQGKLTTILDANVTMAYSVREGSTWKSYIECYDGGYAYANAFSTKAPGVGVDQESILASLVGDLNAYGVSVGQLSTSFGGKTPKGQAIIGPTTDLLTELTGGAFYIFNSKVYIVTDTEWVRTTVPTIDASSGLLGTPRKEQTLIIFDMLLEPGLVVGQLINLKSQEGSVNGANFNGIHKVVGLHHHGSISQASCGEAITTVTMQGNQFQNVSETTVGG